MKRQRISEEVSNNQFTYVILFMQKQKQTKHFDKHVQKHLVALDTIPRGKRLHDLREEIHLKVRPNNSSSSSGSKGITSQRSETQLPP